MDASFGSARGDQVTQIRVNDVILGIVGLKPALAWAAGANMPSNETTARQLLERLRAANYIPVSAEADYAEALLREYRRHRGEPTEAVKSQGLLVEVLGPGCPACERLTELVRNVMASSGIVGSLEHVRDLDRLAKYGLVATPALAINGKLVSSGRVPPEPRVREWLRATASGR